MLDENPDLSICPEAVRTFPGQPGLILRGTTGTPLLPKFCFASEEVSENSLTLHYEDTGNALRYTARFALDPVTHIITAQASRSKPSHANDMRRASVIERSSG